MRILLAGGGTAGHVNPLLSTAAEILRRDRTSQVVALGTAQGLEARLVPEAGIELETIPRVPLPRKPNAEALSLPLRLGKAIKESEAVIERVKPNALVGFGGYVSVPAYLAARRKRVPIVVHEGNAKPGVANKLGARRAAAVAISFPGTPLPRAVLTGLPLRREIASLDRDALRLTARAQLGLNEGSTTLLVTGGSLGAQRINETMIELVPELLEKQIQVLHLTGTGKGEELRRALDGVAGEENYHVLDYLDAMELAYAACDLVVTRAGAGVVSELTCVGLPAVYVPLAIGNGEQSLNAAPVVQAGGGILVPNSEFSPEWARRELLGLLDSAERLSAMAAAAGSLGTRTAAEDLVDLVEKVAR